MRIPFAPFFVVLLIPAATSAQSGGFQARLDEATAAIVRMGLQPETIRSVHYLVLYVGQREFAEQRKSLLEKSRRNFLGFIRRMKIKINERHERLLVIVLDTPAQMRRFFREVSGEEERLADWVAGYYSPVHNWAVFYNQRQGAELANAESWLNDMAQQLLETPGGPNTRLQVSTPDGWVTRTKKQIGTEMTAKWREITQAVTEINASVTQHEGVHQLAFNVGVQHRGAAYPFWVSEGLACQFEVPASEMGRRRMGAARVNGLRLSKYREIQTAGRALGLHRLLSTRLGDPVESVDAMYAESWAAFAFFFHRYPKELSDYLGHLADRVTKGNGEPRDEVASFARFFDRPLSKLQKEWDDYIATLK